jgi:hypothetical protein
MNNKLFSTSIPTVGTTVKISCRLWAKNIVVDKQRRLGMTNLEILSNA